MGSLAELRRVAAATDCTRPSVTVPLNKARSKLGSDKWYRLKSRRKNTPLTIANGGNCRRSSPIRRGRAIPPSSRAGCRTRRSPTRIRSRFAVVTEAGRTDEARLSDLMPRPSPFAATGLGRGLQANYEIWSGQLLLDRLQVPFLTRPRPAGRSQDKFAHMT